MVVISAYQTAVTLFGRDGSVRIFPTKKAARRALGLPWIRDNVGSEFRVFSHTSSLSGYVFEREPVYIERPFVMRDDAGRPLVVEDFAEPASPRRFGYGWSPWRYHQFWNGEGPVPGTGGGPGGKCYRRIGTQSQRRQSFACPEEGEVQPRARRNHRNLPNAWDDYLIAARDDRGWKRHRRTQWKCFR
jgi:hypothetical protein